MYDHALLYTNFASAIIANIACLIYNNDQTESYCQSWISCYVDDVQPKKK